MAADTGRPAPWPTIAKLVLALVATGVLAAGITMPAVLGSGLVGKHYANQFLGTTCNLQETKPPQPTTLFARDGKTVIARLFTQDRKLVSLKQIPKYLQDSLVATEDRRFYSHHGVDLRGLIRSAVNTTSGDTQGGSTLTMQYVKQIRYYQAGDNPKKQAAAIAQTLQRKMEDAKCALDIEGPRGESKGQILQNYLNIAFFGEHAYGIEKAAETYFNEPASKLTLAQSALLVGMLRAPSAYDPFVHPAEAKQRRDEVIQNLVSVGKLSQSAADAQKATPISLATTHPPLVKQGCANSDTTVKNAAFFCEYAVHWLESTGGLKDSQLQTGGLKIITTLNPKIQDSTQANLAQELPATSPMTGVLPVVDPSTGDILAMAASKAYGSKKGQTEQPLFTSYVSGGASTFKLFPLLTALSVGVPDSTPITTVGNTGTYKTRNCTTPGNVKNGDENVSYNNTETLDTATAKSSNTYFVALTDQVLGCNMAPILQLMSQLGMKGMDQPSDTPKQTWAQIIDSKARAQQLVLGSVPASPLELAGAYAAVANNGRFNAPAPILTIRDSAGNAVAVKRVTGRQVISAQAAAYAVKVLKGDTQPNGSAAAKFSSWNSEHPGDQIAGKTGTAVNAKGDKNAGIWFVGMSRQTVGAMGIINFDAPGAASTGLPNVKNGAAYGDYAAKMWLKALRPTLTAESWNWPDPHNVPGDPVPTVTDRSLSSAKKALTRAGYKYAVLGGTQASQCASTETETPGYVGYAGPAIAPKGATILLCVATGAGPTYQAPAPPPRITVSHKPKPKPGHGSGSGGSGGHSGGTGGGHGGGNGGGHHPRH